ncbi:MAG: hypothetical protein KJ709_02210 [Nanoarchaeota archaeon]|nr:hypothetical protein [Nanoarchaeota archaeon]
MAFEEAAEAFQSFLDENIGMAYDILRLVPGLTEHTDSDDVVVLYHLLKGAGEKGRAERVASIFNSQYGYPLDKVDIGEGDYVDYLLGWGQRKMEGTDDPNKDGKP